MNKTKINAAILGATGYAGVELVRLLAAHPYANIVHLASHSYAGKRISEVHPALRWICDLVLQEDDLMAAAEAADVVFMALPAGIAADSVDEAILAKAKVIDLGADFRLHDKAVYEQWYKKEHHGDAALGEAVYGLCELHRDEVRGARLVANPGCYTTCSILSLYPLLKAGLVCTDGIIIDAKSGTSGAGRGAKTTSLFCEVDESIKAYGLATHRHTPEIEQELSLAAGVPVTLQFTPHLVPMNRGILATCYARVKKGVGADDVKAAYEIYSDEPFIRLCDSPVETRNVKGGNFVDIYWQLDERTGNIIVLGAIDNLVKGAAGQAVQNMNLLFGLDEGTGLMMAPGATL